MRCARPPRPSILCGEQHLLLSLAASLLILLSPARGHAFTAEQARQGAEIFRRQCARCHGPYGEGRDNAFKGLRAPELIGGSALPLRPRAFQKIRHRDFRTAEDVFNFASAAMPADQPASLYAEEYWAVVAFVLSRNGTPPDGQPLTAASSAVTALDHRPAAPSAAPPEGSHPR